MEGRFGSRVRAGWGALFLAGIAAGALLLAYSSLTRTRIFTPDSLLYLDAAVNLTEGKGLVLSHLQSSQIAERPNLRPYHPFVEWGPLYPMAAASLIALGFSPGDALLIVSGLCGVLLLGAVHLLLFMLYDAPFARLATVCVGGYLPFRMVSTVAWSETLGMTLVVLGMCAIAFSWGQAAGPQGTVAAAIAGALCGLGFSARYALLPAGVLGFAVYFALWMRGRRRIQTLVSFAAGWLLIIGAVLLRNYLLCGNPLGERRPAAEAPVLEHAGRLWRALAQGYLSPAVLGGEHQQLLLVSALLLLMLPIVLRRRYFAVWEEVVRGPRALLLLWSAVYFAFLMIAAARVQIDPIGPRLVMPGAVTLIPILLATLRGGLYPSRRVQDFLAAMILAAVLLGNGRSLRSTPADDRMEQEEARDWATWIDRITESGTFLVSDRSMELPLFGVCREGIHIAPTQDPSRQLSYELLVPFFEEACSEKKTIVIAVSRVLPIDPAFEYRWKQHFGAFVTDVAFGRLSGYPRLRLLAREGDRTAVVGGCD